MRFGTSAFLFMVVCLSSNLNADNPIDPMGFEIIKSDSFEGKTVVENYVDTVIPPSSLINSNGVIVATGDEEAAVKISNAFNEHQQPGLLIEVSGGNVNIDLSGLSALQSGLHAPLTAATCPDQTDPSYPIKYSCNKFKANFVDISVYVPFSLVKVDQVSGARVPNGSTLNENFGISYNRVYFVESGVDAAKLTSGCANYGSCSGEPVLLVHGYQNEPFGPKLDDNGGRNTWGSFPDRLRADGYIPYEFTWISNARFQDVAGNLKEAIELIKSETGEDVHIVAHSFGGVLTRRLLQDPSLNSIATSIASVSTIGTPHSGIFDAVTIYDDNVYPATKFPNGQHNTLLEGCGQISCHVMGEDGFGSLIPSLLQFPEDPGSEPYFLANTISALPAVNIQILIGFQRDVLAPEATTEGDGLISGNGQRFHPDLVFTGAGVPEWEGALDNSSMGAALVSEFFLGRLAASDADPILQPTSVGVPIFWQAFAHSSALSKGADLIEPWIPVTSFHDVYQRVLDFIGGPKVPPSPLNDTGIDWGGNYPSGNNATCIGETMAAQDCSHGRDATHDDDSDGHAGFSFTKLDANGNALPPSATGWDCVRDEVTGLIWEAKTDDGGLHDTDNFYSWYNPDPATNGGNPGTQNEGSCVESICNTYSFVQAVNAQPQALCGARDWRMPWLEELLSIVDYGRNLPAIDTVYFPHQRSEAVWSGSPYGGNSVGVWWVDFGNGGQYKHPSVINQRVRLVRDGQ